MNSKKDKYEPKKIHINNKCTFLEPKITIFCVWDSGTGAAIICLEPTQISRSRLRGLGFPEPPKKWRLRQQWLQELCERLPKVEVALKGAS